MDKLIIPIDGKETTIKLEKIEIGKLKLDELNPRISFFRDNQVSENLFDNQVVYVLTNKKPDVIFDADNNALLQCSYPHGVVRRTGKQREVQSCSSGGSE